MKGLATLSIVPIFFLTMGVSSNALFYYKGIKPMEQEKMFELAEQRKRGEGGKLLKAWRKIVNFQGKHTRCYDRSDITFLQWAYSTAKKQLSTEDFKYFEIVYGRSYRETLRKWAVASVARKKAGI